MLVPKAATVEAPTYPPVASQTILDLPHFAMVPLPGAGQSRLECCGGCLRVARSLGPLRAGQVPVTTP
jgi:hypothetical protein